MQITKARYILIISFFFALLLGWLITSSGQASDPPDTDQTKYLQDEDRATTTLVNFPTNIRTPTPHATRAIILPIVQQDASLQTPEPQDSGEQFPPPTITPTPVPPQSPEVNTPIVFGAVVIVLIIILAWLFIGRPRFTEGI